VRRHLLLYLWVIALYVVTAVTTLVDVLPVPPQLLEVRNIAVHFSAYAVLGALLAWAVGGSGQRFDRREWAVLLLTALLLGLGQEVLQTVLRNRAYPLNSLLDLAVDVSGAAAGLWLVTRARRGSMAAGASSGLIRIAERKQDE
jgi:VanZ family protein